ncbi:hypothetical protein Bca52824_047987 [Brassica carinata]|uniref:Uncharacterized protein n=1 Tax=Brassica carinata TaxID=52824 RepID=A0A8X7RFN4_BRACI|nr:hypothetical protein Bca52824_047987 [Brassica carinata]
MMLSQSKIIKAPKAGAKASKEPKEMWKENGFSSFSVSLVIIIMQKNNKSHDNEHFTASGDMYAQTSAREDGHQSANNRTIATRISDNIEMECLKCRFFHQELILTCR